MVYKNMIKVHLYICQVLAQMAEKDSESIVCCLEIQLHHFEKMIKNASKAIYYGRQFNKPEWFNAIVEQGELQDEMLQDMLR